MNRDLTTGKPFSVLLRFCLPLFGSILFQQLYNIADSFVAGKFIGENALAAVGNSYEITLIFIAIAFGCNMGCSVVVSQLFGGKHFRDLKTAVSTTLIASGILCLVLMIGGTLFCTDLLRLINTPANILADSSLYLDIYIWGLPFVFYYNIATGIFSALGDSRTPFLFLAASSTANIGMDILFVTVFQMGVAGVAWATFLCQGVSCVLAIIFLFHRFRSIETQGRIQKFSFRLLKKISSIAIPSMLQQSFVSVGNIIIQGVINTFGSSVIAGYSAGIKLNNLAITSLTTIGNGVSMFTAQNLGANQISRIHKGFRSGLALVWVICIPFAAAFLFFGKPLVSIFLNHPSGTAMDVGAELLRIISPFYFVAAMKITADCVLRGTGVMHLFMISTFTDLALRVILAILLSASFGTTGIWLAWPIGWCISTVLSLLFYRFYPWEAKKPVA